MTCMGSTEARIRMRMVPLCKYTYQPAGYSIISTVDY
jgi:hypothetical protein